MEQVFGVIVVFNPQPEVIKNIKSIAKQVDQLLVVDNSGTTAFELQLLNLGLKVKYTWNGNTHGLAGALNKGIVEAQASKADWIIFFDQDSSPSELMVPQLLQFVQTTDNPQIVSIAPNYFDANISKLYFDTQTPYIALDIITSGNLIKLSIFEDARYFFDESMFIYHLDTDLNLKLANNGYLSYRVPTTILNHSEGNKQMINIPFFPRAITLNHNTPFALFYIYRNTVVITKRYLFTHPRFIVLGYTNLAKNFIKIVLFEPHKGSKIFAIAKGIVSGLLAID